ncbi:hypothetical protein M0805_009353 [Coniferiporia weirii]|nr:hypothetical protein M0805_009353 [Coniferiporia weirii]
MAPEEPWDHMTCDFITGLPTSKGHNVILTIVDKLTRMAIFIPTNDTATAKDTANLFNQHVFTKHGIPKKLTLD